MFRLTMRACPFLLLLFLAAESASAQTDGRAANTDAAKAARVDRFGDLLPPEALARFGTMRFRSGSDLRFAVLSPNGAVVAVNGDDQAVHLMDTPTGLIVRQFAPEQMAAYCLAFSPDGAHLATADQTGVIRLHDFPSGRPVRTFTGDAAGMPAQPVFSTNGRVIAGTHAGLTERNEVRVWEVATGKLLAKCKVLQNRQVGATLSNDGKMLASWGAHFETGFRFSFKDPDSSAPQNTVQLWEVQSGKELRRFHMKGTDGVSGVAFAPDGKSIAVAENSGRVVLLNPADGKEIRCIGEPFPADDIRATPVFSDMCLVKFSPDGRRLAVARGGVRIWDATTGKCLSAANGPKCNVSSLVFAGDHVLAAGTLGHAVRVWDPLSGNVSGPTGVHAGCVTSVALVANARTLLSTDSPGGLCFWDPVSGRQGRSATMLQDPALPISTVLLSGRFAGSSVLASRGKYVVLWDHTSGGIRLRDIDADRDIQRFSLMVQGQLAASFSRDGDLVALGGKDSESPGSELGLLASALPGGDSRKLLVDMLEAHEVVELCKTRTGKVVQRFKGLKGMVQGVAVSPDGCLVAAAGMSFGFNPTTKVEICVWDAGSGKQLAKFATSNSFVSFGSGEPLVFSPDGVLLASVDESGTVRLREATTGKSVCTLAGNNDSKLSALSFSPDGHVLAVGLRETPSGQAHQRGKIQLWELSTASVRKEFTGHAGDVTSLAWSADGRLLASGSADTTVLLWDVSGEKLRPRSRTRLNLQEAGALWRELGSARAPQAYQTILRLASAPEDAVALFHKKLKPAAPAPDEKEMKRLTAQLDSQRFAEREAAATRLKVAGKAVLPVLQRVLKTGPSPELRQRAQKLIEEISRTDLPADGDMASARALEVLEIVNSAEARALLKDLAQGRADAGLTREAKAVLARLSASR